MEEFLVNTGIPQGSPLSPILFLFFNVDLIEQILAECPDVIVLGYIDDIFIMTYGTSAAANCCTLTKVHQVAERWERTHASKFAPAKYQLTHFWRKHQMVPKPSGRLDVPLTIKGVEIKPTYSIKYLGVYVMDAQGPETTSFLSVAVSTKKTKCEEEEERGKLALSLEALQIHSVMGWRPYGESGLKRQNFYLDTHLTWEVHVQEMRKKAAKLVAGLSSIAGSTWGTPLVHLRKIYTAVLQPQIMYACSTWYIQGERGFTGAQRAAEQAIQSIQDQALHQISSAFKRTSRQALEVCLHVPPAELTLAKLAEEACLRIMTSPLRSTLYQIRGQAHRNGLEP
ncbi:hypothetical protein TSTA_010910 [Talaromyces stipitatus ATCC 10500]|uniref:Reverse transcriptase domain-containing protein n=1 Tax=Talaromyces stipitatus (strain ATCC 10500 / CBS 375.48 / QM 6759 / NRRL 1006) TaxID=441959 RepID=B8MHJ4_TALSN|nr:uncharacterized protein TSTA_010910 [Talaromyces stipitatus ATCC 10500]EED15975.1 hypothetical protein TSTA_010910 [Talaromyces stipitatus ATCC 10500]